MGCRKYRFFPTIGQQHILREWMGTARYMYNLSVHNIQNENKPINWQKLRNMSVPKKVIPKGKEWLLRTPKEVRVNSIKEVVTAYKVNFKKLKRKQISHFSVRYRSKKKMNKEIITIPKTAIKIRNQEFKVYSRTIKKSIKLKTNKLISINNEVKIIHIKRCNLWYLCVPIEYNIINAENQSNNNNVVSIDPGVKTFLTVYDKDG